MCNSAEDDEETALIPIISRASVNKNVCNKCKAETPCVVLRNKDAYCESCFLHGTSHKFKGLLGKHRLIHPNDSVLIVHRCGHPTTALLHLIRTGLDMAAQKKLRFKPNVLYIVNNDFNSEVNVRLLTDIENEVKRFNFPMFFVRLLDYVKNPSVDVSDIVGSAANVFKSSCAPDSFAEQSSSTIKDELCLTYRRRLIIDVAKRLRCRCVFTLEIAADIGTDILTNVALGRGSHLSLDVGICDDRDPDVKIIKPLRFFDIKELAFYNVFNRLEPVHLPVSKVPINHYSSVQSLSRKFVLDLQQNYPATIMTIVRTGDKLTLNQDMENNTKCSLCKAPIDTKSSVLSSNESTKFSHYISTIQRNSSNILEQDFNNIVANFYNNDNVDYCVRCTDIVCNIDK